MPSSLRANKKLLRKSQLSLLMSYMQQEVESVGSHGVPPVSLFKLLATDDLLGGALFGDEDALREEVKERVSTFFTGELDGMAIVSDTFNYDHCMDLIKLSSEEPDLDSADFWPILLAIFGQKANKKSFFYGRRVGPTLADVELIVSKLSSRRDTIDE